MDNKACNGNPGQFTCHANKEAKESRISYILANQWLFPALEACRVDQCDQFPTHRPLLVSIRVQKLEQFTRKLQTTTDYAKMIEEKIQLQIEKERSEEQPEEE